jgi:hypothetical protein
MTASRWYEVSFLEPTADTPPVLPIFGTEQVSECTLFRQYLESLQEPDIAWQDRQCGKTLQIDAPGSEKQPKPDIHGIAAVSVYSPYDQRGGVVRPERIDGRFPPAETG